MCAQERSYIFSLLWYASSLKYEEVLYVSVCEYVTALGEKSEPTVLKQTGMNDRFGFELVCKSHAE